MSWVEGAGYTGMKELSLFCWSQQNKHKGAGFQ